MWNTFYRIFRTRFRARSCFALAHVKAADSSNALYSSVAASLVAIGATCTVNCDMKVDKGEVTFRKEIFKVLRSDQIVMNDDECLARGKPWNSYHKVENHPHFIVYPESTEDVSAVLKLCTRFTIPVVPFGSGTSLEGQTLAPYGGISLDFSRMNRVTAIHPGDLDCTVQAGLSYNELNAILAPYQLHFPLDPGPGASIGGMCACRCSGSTAVRYGSMRENVLSVTAVLADGTIIKTGNRARKSSAGYDLTRLLIGSEGTLGLITEVTLKLHPIPAYTAAVRLSFSDLRDAAATAKATLNCGVLVGRCELMDDVMIKILNQNIAPTGNKKDIASEKWPEHHTLLYEVTASSPASLLEQQQIITRIAKEHRAHHVVTSSSPATTTAIWRMRKEALWTIMGQYPDREPLITDVCVPLTQLPEMMQYTRDVIGTTDLPCPIIAHAGDGNIHVIIMFDPKSHTEAQTAKGLAKRMAEKAISLDGTCTGEHGVGVGKMDLLTKEMGDGSIKLMKSIKHVMDPQNILNPGKVLHMKPPAINKKPAHVLCR